MNGHANAQARPGVEEGGPSDADDPGGVLQGLSFSTDMGDGGLDFGAGTDFDFGAFPDTGDTFDYTQFLIGGDDEEVADGGMIGLWPPCF
jgi:hypothetical protein